MLRPSWGPEQGMRYPWVTSAFGSGAQSGNFRAMWNGGPLGVKLVKRQARRRKEIKVKTFQKN